MTASRRVNQGWPDLIAVLDALDRRVIWPLLRPVVYIPCRIVGWRV